MAYEQRVGSVNLFQNRDKKNDKHPDFKGKVDVLVGDQIVTVELAMWRRSSEKAGEYLGLTAKAASVRPNEDMDQAFTEDGRE